MFNRLLIPMPLLVIGLVAGSAMADVPKVPEQVDKALRARVMQFFQYHVDGNFRKAMDMVADDTKDEYFATGKSLLKSFILDDIKYSDKFDSAIVTITVVRDWEIRMQHTTVTLPMVTTWRVEHGEWVWYHDKQGEWLTPMGPSDYKAIKPNADGTVTLPPINQDSVMAAARNIMQASGVDKLEILFQVGKAGSDKIVFRNGAEGGVQLEMTSIRPVPGLTMKWDKVDVKAGETATLEFHYEPQEKDEASSVEVPFTVVPFNTTYVAHVRFAHEGQ